MLRACLSAALLLLLAAPARGAGWTAPLPAAGGAAPALSDVAVGTGTVAVAWTSEDRRVLAAVAPAGGQFSAAQELRAGAPAAAPEVAVGPDGETMVASSDAVHVRSAESTAFAAALTDVGAAPSLGFTGSGTGIVAWWAGGVRAAIRPRGERFRVVGIVAPGAGETMTAAPRVATAERGPGLVAWATQRDGVAALRAMRIAADGSLGPVLTLDRADAGAAPAGGVAPAGGTAPPGAAITAHAVALDGQGNAEIAYRLERPEPAASEVRAVTLPAGAPAGPPRVLDRATPIGPPVAAADATGAAVAWQRSDRLRVAVRGPGVGDAYGPSADLAQDAAPSGLVRVADGLLLGAGGPGAQFSLRPPGGGFVPLVPLAPSPSAAPRLASDGRAGAAALIGGQVRLWDAAPPTFERLSVPARARVAQRVRFAIRAGDRLSPVTFVWDLGDGGRATTDRPAHCYTRPGSYAVRAIATDGAGNVAAQTRRLAVRRTRRMAIGCLAASTETVALRPGRDASTPRSVVTTFVLSRRARLRIVVRRRVDGRWRTITHARYRAWAGANRLRIGPNRFGGHRLRAGRYRLTMLARASGGGRTARAVAGLRVVDR